MALGTSLELTITCNSVCKCVSICIYVYIYVYALANVYICVCRYAYMSTRVHLCVNQVCVSFFLSSLQSPLYTKILFWLYFNLMHMAFSRFTDAFFLFDIILIFQMCLVLGNHSYFSYSCFKIKVVGTPIEQVQCLDWGPNLASY